MSQQKNMLRDIAKAINANGDFLVTDWFTEDFRLSEPTKADWPVGYAGAHKLLETFKTLTPPINMEILDMVEEGDRVAVRWRLSTIYRDEPVQFAMMAIYRFRDNRIAEDWGIPIRGDWP
jgi:predicted SnoaL-like aldol condensation-catalyzing enzyme